jgi:hypothetical protein
MLLINCIDLWPALGGGFDAAPAGQPVAVASLSPK